MEVILNTLQIELDDRARNGEWCCKFYPGHKKGCPNYPKCIIRQQSYKTIRWAFFKWVAIIEEFNLKNHAEKMKMKHPKWTERQCRNLLYWQGGVRKRLTEKMETYAIKNNASVFLRIPEANGINVFATMENHGIILERKDPGIIRKIMIVGIVK